MLGAAVFGAKHLIRAWPCWLEPDLDEPAGNDVCLHAHRRNRKIMNDVFRRHDQLDRPTDRHVQLVDLALPGRMLHLPHPLFADDVNVQRLLGRAGHHEVHLRAPEKNDQRDEERHERPRRLQHESAVHLRAHIICMPAVKLHGEADDERGDLNGHDERQTDKEEVESIDLAGDCGCALREERDTEHVR